MVGTPFLFTAYQLSITCRELRRLVAERVQRHVVPSEDGAPAFELRIQENRGLKCNRCFGRDCPGCPIPDTDEPIDLLPRTCIAVCWAQGRFDPKEQDVIVHESVPKREAGAGAASSSRTLLECLNENAKGEVLGKDDMWYCSKCKDHRQAFKKMEMWSAPDVLVIHLKRFSFTKLWREKLDMFVDFPLEGLDLSSLVLGPVPEGGYIYDCYGVSNHMGGLGGGHYTAYVRNANDNQWYLCDDSHVSPASPEQIKSRSAYVLFYQRRGAALRPAA